MRNFTSALRCFWLITVLAGVTPTPVLAQSAGDWNRTQQIKPGTSLTVALTDGSTVRGRFVGASATELALEVSGRRTTLEAAGIQRVRTRGRGLPIGLAIGLGAGLGIGLPVNAIAANEGGGSPGTAAIVGGAVGGALLGVLLGNGSTVYDRATPPSYDRATPPGNDRVTPPGRTSGGSVDFQRQLTPGQTLVVIDAHGQRMTGIVRDVTAVSFALDTANGIATFGDGVVAITPIQDSLRNGAVIGGVSGGAIAAAIPASEHRLLHTLAGAGAGIGVGMLVDKLFPHSVLHVTYAPLAGAAESKSIGVSPWIVREGIGVSVTLTY